MKNKTIHRIQVGHYNGQKFKEIRPKVKWIMEKEIRDILDKQN